ncbi:hemolysin family protein [Candidatus Woesearchaeota archaeon]|nr:hemolysin family protein [Candidatus Woesearchaeota archaeon]
MIEDIIVLVFLILISGFFSSAEIAFFSLGSLRLKHLVDKKIPGANTVKYLKDRPRKLLDTILIGNNLVNIGASVFATTIAMGIFKSNVIGIVTGIMTFVILVFGEIVPKTFAIAHSEAICIVFAKPLKLLMWISYPVILVLDLINKMLHIETIRKKPLITEEELKSYVTAGEEVGEISEEEKEMIQRVFRFDDINVNEIMTPRTEMVILNSKAKVRGTVEKILRSGYSRYPVYEKNRDKIVGIVNAWDIFKAVSQRKKDISLQSVMSEPGFVPETMKVDELLKHFLKRKHHLAVVIDEYGGTAGLVTLEDVLEEMVGEIIDERDRVEPEITKIGDKAWKVLGRMDIDKFFNKFKVTRKKGDFDTVNGFLIDRLGRIPKLRQKIRFRNYDVTITEMSGNRIKEIKVVRK